MHDATRIAAATVALLLVSASGAAVVGANGSDGDMRIMGGGSSASATTGVGPDGVSYRAEVTQRNATCLSNATDTGVHDVATAAPGNDSDTGTVTVTGVIRAANPCATLDHAVEETADGYVLDVTTQPGDGMCVQCVGMVRYEASFSAPGGFTLAVEHDGEQVKTVTVDGPAAQDPEAGDPPRGRRPGQQPPDDTETVASDRGLVGGLLSWLSGLL